MTREPNKEAYIPIIYCNKCQCLQPINIETFVHEKTGQECRVAYCCICETVLNIGQDIEPAYVTEGWLLERGWELVEGGEKETAKEER